MIFTTKFKNSSLPVYFGHPSSFWKDRQRDLTAAPININEMNKQKDMVEYDALHLTKSIINRTSTKLNKVLQKEDNRLKLRRIKLKHLLEREEEQYIQELVTKQEMEECNVCVEQEKKLRMYEEEIEREKVRECQKALEREKIAKGMQCTKVDELYLREMQKLQMIEKRNRELEEEQREKMWHQVLIENVNRKDELERRKQIKLQEEMIERRMMYDYQIASATRRRNQALEQERQKELRRIEKIKQKVHEDHLEAIKRKKEQQLLNKRNYIEGYRNKISRLEGLKNEERVLDNRTIEMAMDEVQKQKYYDKMMMRKLQQEKQIFLENYQNERRIASELDFKEKLFIEDSRKAKENKSDGYFNLQQAEKMKEKEKSAEDYKRYLEQKRRMSEEERRDREVTMERVREAAEKELQSKLENAYQEFRKQMEYRDNLNFQIVNNQKVMFEEEKALEKKQKYFLKKMDSFQDAMARKVDKSPGRISTIPIHPFAKILLKKEKNEDSRLPTLL